MLSAPVRILIVAGVCVLALIGLVVRESYERSHTSSRDIEMEMQAIDPRALLAGHYVIINLQTQLPAGDAEDPCAIYRGGGGPDDWLALAYVGPEYRVMPPEGTPFPYAPIGIAPSRGAAETVLGETNPAGVAARGTVQCSVGTVTNPVLGDYQRITLTTQLPGIERFYASQQEAERIDALLRGQADGQVRVYAIINIGRDGRARLKGLNVNGEVILLNFF